MKYYHTNTAVSKHFWNGDDTINTRCFLQFFSLIPKSNNNNDAASNTSSSFIIEGSCNRLLLRKKSANVCVGPNIVY